MGEVLRRAAGYLADRGCDTPRLDAEVLLADTLGVDRLALYTDHDRPLDDGETARYREAIARRGRREPVAYITGRKAFRNLQLAVGPAVLVPRPETEVLVEWVVAEAPRDATVLDWGTGSGAVALAVAQERPDVTVTAIDRSADALAVARGNDPSGAVEWLVSDGFGSLTGRRFHVIAANPPYLAEADAVSALPELGFEPVGALVAGPTGYEALEAIARDAPAHLEPGGWLMCEVGQGQAADVAARLGAAGFDGVRTRSDLAGIERVIAGRRP